MNTKKISIIVKVILGLAAISTYVFIPQKGVFGLDNNQDTQNTDMGDTQNYYDKLASNCKTKASENCCLASVKAMKACNCTLVPEEGCPAGYQPEAIRCKDSYRWCQPVTDLTTQAPAESIWKVFHDSRHTFQFEYPLEWKVENRRGAIRGLILKDEAGKEIISVDTGVNLAIIGISYCGAYPQDERCEVLKTINGSSVTIDWDVSGKANAMFSSQDGAYGVSFTLHKINSDTKIFFRKILSTFQFVK